jgi:hypothetical protein
VAREQQRHGRICADAVAETVDQEQGGAGQRERAGDDSERAIEGLTALDVGVDIRSPCRDEQKGCFKPMSRDSGNDYRNKTPSTRATKRSSPNADASVSSRIRVTARAR